MASSPPWHDPETLTELYHEEGLSQADIADRLGCSPPAICYQMNKSGIKARQYDYVKDAQDARRKDVVSFGLSNHGYERWQTSYKADWEQVYIHRLLAVAEFGFNAVRDKQIHHKNGVKWDNRPENIEPLDTCEHERLHVEQLKGLTPEECVWRDEEWLCQKYHRHGWTQKRMAEEAGVTDATISRWMDFHGIDRRDCTALDELGGDE